MADGNPMAMTTPTVAHHDQLLDRRRRVDPGALHPTIPDGQARHDDQPRHDVALCASYAEAVLAAERLAERGFPVEHLTIVADSEPDVRWGPAPRSPGRAAVQGLAGGALAGGLIGVLFGLLHRVDPVATAFVAALYGVVLGALAGATSATLAHLVRGHDRPRTGAPGIALEPPTARQRHAIVAEDPASWVRAVTTLHGGAAPRHTPATDAPR